MPYRTVIAARELLDHYQSADWAVVDCRFNLADTERGEAEYLASHVPGAVYAHLARDLSAPVTGRNGRHPLPSVDALADCFSRWGISSGVQVVGYDNDSGQMAARLWWTLRYMGHDDVAVLDEGWKAWIVLGAPLRSGREERARRDFIPKVRPEMRVDVDEVAARSQTRTGVLIDARAPERYRGEVEPLDPVAGRIPGAVNHFWQKNLDENGRFLPPTELRARYEVLASGTLAANVVVYCGSGVTACHDLLAMEHAGLHGAMLYPGSWSEWCSEPRRPVEKE